MANTINAQEVVAEYGAYYIPEGQNEKRLIEKLIYGFDTLKYMTPISQDSTLYRMSNSLIADVLQPFKKKFSPTNGLTFKPNPIQLFQNKVDQEYYPNEIVGNWLGFLASNKLDRKEWPFVKWLMEKKLIPKVNENLEDAIFHAKWLEPNQDNDTPGALLDILNGLKYQLVNGIGNGLNRIILNDLTTSNIFDEVEKFRKGISLAYRRTDLKYFMSPTWAEAYMEDKRNTFPAKSLDDYAKVDFAPHMVVGLPCMEGSNIIFSTPQENLLYLTKNDVNATKFQVESSKRLVSIMSDFWQGVGFGTLQGVFAYIPDSEISSGSGSGS